MKAAARHFIGLAVWFLFVSFVIEIVKLIYAS